VGGAPARYFAGNCCRPVARPECTAFSSGESALMHLDKNALLDWHQQAFGRPADLIASAPGRVNLIGEHNDYNQGFVLPVAINYYTHVSASARGDRRLELVARDMGGQRVSLDLDGPMQRDPLAP